MKEKSVLAIKIIIVCYIVLSVTLYLFQEKILFMPTKLEQDYSFHFKQNFEELSIEMSDKKKLNALLFKSDSTKGLIFYLHGNAGSLASWGYAASTFTDLNYDVFILDYRGYGKSQGKITNENQLYEDIQITYNKMLERYNEKNISVLGYSIGTGMAAKLAADNNPKMLILQAPYFNMPDLVHNISPVLPTFVLKYTFDTDLFIKKCTMPIVLFHGTNDKIIYYGSSVKLSKSLKSTDSFITLDGFGHNGMSENVNYNTEIKRILEN